MELSPELVNGLKIIGELILAFLVGVGGYKVQQRLTSSTIKKQDSEATNEITQAAIELVKPLREELKQLREELKCQKCEIDRLKQFEVGVRILITQLKRLNIVPDWLPPEVEGEDKNKNEQVRNIITDRTPR